MKLDFSKKAAIELVVINKRGGLQMINRIRSLLDEIKEHPRWGTGKPERLKHFDGDTWSRRIDRKTDF